MLVDNEELASHNRSEKAKFLAT